MCVAVFEQKYKARRDIPKAVRELKTLSPSKIRDWIRDHRTKRDKVTGKRVQVNVTPESITMWFRRHLDFHEALKREIQEEELPKEAISETIFENGIFREIPSVKNWVRDLTNKGAKPQLIRNWVSYLKRICRGNVRKGEFIED